MTPFYSILKVPVNSAGQEYLNVGLLLVSEHNLYFRLSNKKLQVVKKLIPKNAFKLLKWYLNGVSKAVTSPENELPSQFRNASFITYLANYNNNLITFSTPTCIDLEVDEIAYRTLFEKIVFMYEPAWRDVICKDIGDTI